ncbi:hypothetical protein [Corynebacterium sp. J010B-136]|uniref:hypothetical protein n=1 Tax=Corynebacterium sp. J010B-136 TaxID=2099401 RepID=UPI0011B0753A|nr:hypothetical protein [Corynebacterium sp. J010B-136]
MRQARTPGMDNHLGIRATTLYDTADESTTISSCPVSRGTLVGFQPCISGSEVMPLAIRETLFGVSPAH